MQLVASGFGEQHRAWRVDKTETEDFSRVYYILSGRVTYRDDRESRRLSPGKMYVFPPRRTYFIRHDPEAPITCLWFHINFFPYHFDRLLEFDPEGAEGATLRGLLAAFLAEQEEVGGTVPHPDGLYAALTEALAQRIYRHPAVHPDDPRWVEVLEYMQAQLASPTLDVAAISQRFGSSPEHFIRCFREHMNTTPYQYLTALRMTQAVRALSEGATVAEAAAGCGYRDSKTFARTFRNYYGVPPSQYFRFYTPQA